MCAFNEKSKSAAKELVAMWLRDAASVSCYHKSSYSFDFLILGNGQKQGLWGDEEIVEGDVVHREMETIWDVEQSAFDGNYFAMVGPANIPKPHWKATYDISPGSEESSLRDEQIIPQPELWCFWPDFVQEYESVTSTNLDLGDKPVNDLTRLMPYAGKLNLAHLPSRRMVGLFQGHMDRVEVLPIQWDDAKTMHKRDLIMKFSNVFPDDILEEWSIPKLQKPNRR